jgi:dihydroorotate dehydrogenase (NAD+) catalytic subunit
MDLSVAIGTSRLRNPVGVASGTFGYGCEYFGLADFSAIACVYTKTVTLEPRAGNDPPRLIETPSGLLNSIGLANVGVRNFIKEKIPLLAECPSDIVANFAGFSEDEYVRSLDVLEECGKIWGYEVNVSCPNVSGGGIAFGSDPRIIERLTKRLRKKTIKPLIVKLTPNVTDIAGCGLAAEAGGADAVSCINTLVGMAIDTRTKKPLLANVTGGLSGPAIKPVGLAAVFKTARRVKIPVIGIGGIASADDAIQYLLAGASAIQIGTANFVDPQAARKVLDGITEYCEREGIKSHLELRNMLMLE